MVTISSHYEPDILVGIQCSRQRLRGVDIDLKHLNQSVPSSCNQFRAVRAELYAGYIARVTFWWERSILLTKPSLNCSRYLATHLADYSRAGRNGHPTAAPRRLLCPSLTYTRPYCEKRVSDQIMNGSWLIKIEDSRTYQSPGTKRQNCVPIHWEGQTVNGNDNPDGPSPFRPDASATISPNSRWIRKPKSTGFHRDRYLSGS